MGKSAATKPAIRPPYSITLKICLRKCRQLFQVSTSLPLSLFCSSSLPLSLFCLASSLFLCPPLLSKLSWSDSSDCPDQLLPPPIRGSGVRNCEGSPLTQKQGVIRFFHKQLRARCVYICLWACESSVCQCHNSVNRFWVIWHHCYLRTMWKNVLFHTVQASPLGKHNPMPMPMPCLHDQLQLKKINWNENCTGVALRDKGDFM